MINKKIVILPCAGSGSRFGSVIPKQYTLIKGKTILEHTLNIFLSLDIIDRVIIVTAPDDCHIDSLLTAWQVNFTNYNKIQVLKIGGITRAHTVRNAVDWLECENNDWILVHDVARCCISKESVLYQISVLLDETVGGILAISAIDTIKQSMNGKIIDKTLKRSTIYQAQTPQMFRAGILKKALNSVDLDLVTDEASAVEHMGLSVKLVAGNINNIKITYPLDIELAKIIFSNQLEFS
ncbi:MAG: 2-C-methyl-D-erythritol 4-phosphate cytidylyltransferase [Burkholderiales bacterium]|jgi:2-C-methyl-D-erythritol 4-phosphate cytidylyltransferase|nr:2-C-methyl-D-erythritol 4-phosphate cytidylyltransferase [Burkholderiales bacterium]